MRVVAPDVGGGFGLKGGSFPDDVLVLWASNKLRRPVKWVATRSESMMNDHTGRDLVSYGELALDENGKILAIRSQSLFQIGAYFVGPGMFTGLFSLRFIPEAYDVQTMHIVCKGLFTNTPQAGPYRGAGPPGGGLFHRAHDRARRKADRDGRRGNPAPQPDRARQIPLRDADPLRVRLRRVRAAARQVHRDGRLEGLREAPQGLGEERQAARPLGLLLHRVRRHFQRPHGHPLRSGRQRHGVRRHAFARAGARDRVRAARARIPRRAVREIHYVQGDTAQVQFGRGTYGARSAVVGGSSLKFAADAIIEKAKPMAAAMMEADAGDIEFEDGMLKVAGTDKAIPLTEVAKASYRADGADDQVRHRAGGDAARIRRNRRAIRTARTPVEVEIDPETGEVTVERYVMVDDLGQVLNPMIVNGQQHGGVAQGIGQALYEHAVYDRETAQLVTGSVHGLRDAARRHGAELRDRAGRSAAA